MTNPDQDLKEEIEILKTAQKGHDKIVMDNPTFKEKLEKIEELVDMEEFLFSDINVIKSKLKSILDSKE